MLICESGMSIKSSINPPVFFSSVFLIALMVFVGAIWPSQVQLIFKSVQSWFELKAGWLYILGVAVFLIFIIFVMMSRFGDQIRPRSC